MKEESFTWEMETSAALGMGFRRGTLQVGKVADLALWGIDEPAELSYRVGKNALIEVTRGDGGS